MRLYTTDDEVRLAVARDLRDWTAAGLLTPDQHHTLAADLTTDLRRTGVMLRLGLAAFTVIAGGAAIGLVMLVTDLTSEVAIAVTTAVLGSAALAGATWVVRRYRLYRYGVEEALTMGAVALFGVSGAMLNGAVFGSNADGPAWSTAMVTVAGAAFFAYRRFGFQYALVGSMGAVALIPMPWDWLGVDMKRTAAAAVFAVAFAHATRWRQRADDDITRADAEVLRAAAAAAAYLALNVALTREVLAGAGGAGFRWMSWVITWLLPCVVGRAAIVDRDTRLLRVAMAMTLASLTNKAYLGQAHQPWDPMLLGVLLTVVALALRRWLSSGPDGERRGFTARQLAARDSAAIQIVSAASAAMQPAHVRQVPDAPDPPTFSGGRSGGGGASSDF